MNYLAHILLSQQTELSIIGNIMGDFTRGINKDSLDKSFVLGIKNHLEVDRYTDSHNEVLNMRTLFSRDKRRFAGIILDVLFDHFLHKHWNNFSTVSKWELINYSYNSFIKHKEKMPPKMKKATFYMIQGDWLGSYEELSSVGYALDRLSERVSFKNRFSGSLKEIKINYYKLEAGFLKFFPELQLHIKKSGIERNEIK